MGNPDPFRQESRQLHHQRVYYILLAGIGTLLLLTLLDTLVEPGLRSEFLQYRLLAIGACVLLLYINHTSRSYRWTWLIGFFGYSAVSLAILFSIYRQGDAATPYYVGLMVAMTIYTTLAPLSVFQTIASGFALAVLFVITIFFIPTSFGPGQQLGLFSNLFFMIGFIFIAATRNWTDINARKREHLLRTSEHAAAEALAGQARRLELEVARRADAQQATEEHYQLLFETIADNVALIDTDGMVLQANTSFLHHFTPGTLSPGTIFYDLADSEDQRILRSAVSTLITDSTPISDLQVTLTTVEGTPLLTEISGALLQRENKIPGVQLIIRDISERKHLEKVLASSLHKLRQTENATILALAKLSEYRDITPGRHLERIREYCKTLATAARDHGLYAEIITPTYVQNLYQGSILHDIGKVAVSNEILNKTEPLTVSEQETLRNHTLTGGDVIKAMEQDTPGSNFLSLAKNMAYFHHERWDGTGYPYGLQGNEIPLEARIIAVADAYEEATVAMLQDRCLTHRQAVDSIVNNAGRHFDPMLIDAFLTVQEEFNQIRQTLVETE
ncbi:HD domain-containing phosphohydrolase [Desulfobulbus oligotrophicus]|jgi:PAS domain S-box-containing protein|uniref:HD domain-containing protein n=1 Tax=Desulfobulbus oligotrophicus TaxID=1909699 RepID=A0A7T5VCD5_9BACT|nr:HD domain-containing phosphohydrolase [Desulfobulbus oligotrophicus]MDY0390076.1 HD domain-containing phosphohydrolase [Desulfobulbus oligotrophicus]QQG65186.1 HD domain-containing protein [Desulfobulbus oligotrophicus]